MPRSQRDRMMQELEAMGETFARDRYAQLGRDAGLHDIGRRRYGPNEVPGQSPEEERLLISPYQSDIRAAQGVNSMVADPERFSSAVTRMPPSENVQYGKPAGLMDWIRASAWAVR